MHSVDSVQTSKTQFIITATPSVDTTFDALFGNLLLAAGTRQPFLDGCRILVGLGFDPSTMAVMVHAADPDRICLRARIGAAAGQTVKERDRGGIGFEPWKAFSRSPVEPPIDFKRNQAPECRPTLAASLAGGAS